MKKGKMRLKVRFVMLDLLDARERLLASDCPACEERRIAVDERLLSAIAGLERMLGSGEGDSDGGERR
jgi:hypothetical protein